MTSPAASSFAVIIAIDKYTDHGITDLRGAVKDANAFEKLLTSKLGVSKDRIINLRDEAATREEILKALRSLAHHSAISSEDPILIYFSGHGSQTSPPRGWPTNSPDDKIQMLIPHDFVSRRPNGDQGSGILDITLSQILNDIAKNKSDNITVILDCCHAGSGTRNNASDETFAVRSIELPDGYAVSVDPFSSEVQGGSSLMPHVLLAACKPDQVAIESHEGGAFTRALVKEIKKGNLDKITYAGLIRCLPELSKPSRLAPFILLQRLSASLIIRVRQDPQCEGVNQNRILFTKVHDPQSVMCPIQQVLDSIQTDGQIKYKLYAGEARGVAKNAEFTIYSDRRRSTAIGSVAAISIAPFESYCTPLSTLPIPLPQPAYAVQTGIGDRQHIPLFIKPSDALCEEMRRQDSEKHERSFRLVESPEQAELCIRTQGGLVGFEIMDQMCRRHGLTRMAFDNVRVDDLDHLFAILNKAANFYRHLRLSNNNKQDSLAQKVDLECFELNSETTDVDGAITHYANPRRNGQILITDGVFKLKASSSDYEPTYGYKVTNKSNLPLYAALFHFDPNDLSIGNVAAPVSPG
ncbi:hypothetical protein DXG01_009684 [Tephrocybe rancida]|nr:hypothetical protein DXG01_009684 [Tephrocybe rancida]